MNREPILYIMMIPAVEIKSDLGKRGVKKRGGLGRMDGPGPGPEAPWMAPKGVAVGSMVPFHRGANQARTNREQMQNHYRFA